MISIDQTCTKQLETVFGSAESASEAISKLTNMNLIKKSWMIFGFGKIGRGLAYYCVNNGALLIVADVDQKARYSAESFGIKTVNPNDSEKLRLGLTDVDIIVTATGRSGILGTVAKIVICDEVTEGMRFHFLN